MKKFEALVQQRLESMNLPDANRCIFNFTNKELPKEVCRTFSLEPNFGLQIQNKKALIPQVIKDLEQCVGAVKVEDCSDTDLSAAKENLRARSINIVSNFCKINALTWWYQNQIKGTLRFREEYEWEMGVLINDKATYQPLHRDPTLKFQKRANDLVADLSSTGIIDEAEAKILQSNYTLAPRIYGLRKIYKPTCKLRPVVSCVQSPSYKLSRFVHEILTPVVKTFRFNLQIRSNFKTVELENDYRLISLAVVSLFTNIRKDLVLKVINETWDNIKHLVKVPKDKLIKLVEICFETSYFSFRGTLYGQVEGCSMGNLASPVLANLVMNYKIEALLRNNGYPKSLILASVNKFKEKTVNQRVVGERRSNFIKYCRFPFIPGLSHKINNCFIGTNVRLAYYNVTKIKFLYSKLKDPVLQDQRAGVVYKIPCSCELCYIGQTKQYSKNRIQQHENSCPDVKILDNNKTALALHYFDSGHRFKFDEVKILDLENNWHKRSVSEMVWIKLNDTVNKRTDTQNLSTIYVCRAFHARSTTFDTDTFRFF
ncbi:Protein of unknown function [Cotesia congregata]|uniref:Uncharacterized protein n=1 Tax=Cotesia congregata TaxID=51543 RepID=A0A8J2E0Q7_COTCN|nr:Protein of unknown function [Cotesia congregata]